MPLLITRKASGRREHWLWRDALHAIKWEPGAPRQWDHAGRQMLTQTGTVYLFTDEPWGSGVQALGGANNYLLLPNYSGFNPTDASFTLVIVFNTGSSWGGVGGCHSFGQVGGDETMLNIDDSPAGLLNTRINGTHSIATLAANTSYVAAVDHDAPDNNLHGWVNGKLAATVLAKTPASSTGDFRILNHISGTDRAWDVHVLYAVYFVPRVLTAGEHEELAREPFAPFKHPPLYVPPLAPSKIVPVRY